jgi:hypothetical protein
MTRKLPQNYREWINQCPKAQGSYPLPVSEGDNNPQQTKHNYVANGRAIDNDKHKSARVDLDMKTGDKSTGALKLCKLARRINSEYFWLSQHEDELIEPKRIEFEIHVRHYERLQVRYFKTHQQYYNPMTRVRERLL